MDIRLNGKTLLGIAMLSSCFVLADFVSMVDAKNAGGVNYISVDEEDVANAIDEAKLEMFPIGSVVLRVDTVDPTTLYGGTWTKVTGDASLRLNDTFGDLSNNGIEGTTNTPTVPIRNHSHSSGTLSTQSAGAHNHKYNFGHNFGSGSKIQETVNDSGRDMTTSTTGAHTHTITGTTSETGDGDSPTIDIRGKYFKVNVWKRTS